MDESLRTDGSDDLGFFCHGRRDVKEYRDKAFLPGMEATYHLTTRYIGFGIKLEVSHPELLPGQKRHVYFHDDDAIESISSALDAARATIPTYLGHAPRRIDHHNGYKSCRVGGMVGVVWCSLAGPAPR